jgi:hypothetical protein
MGLCVLATRLLLVHAGTPAAARLVLCIAVGALVYLPAVWWRVPQLAGELRRRTA